LRAGVVGQKLSPPWLYFLPPPPITLFFEFFHFFYPVVTLLFMCLHTSFSDRGLFTLNSPLSWNDSRPPRWAFLRHSNLTFFSLFLFFCLPSYLRVPLRLCNANRFFFRCLWWVGAVVFSRVRTSGRPSSHPFPPTDLNRAGKSPVPFFDGVTVVFLKSLLSFDC